MIAALFVEAAAATPEPFRDVLLQMVLS